MSDIGMQRLCFVISQTQETANEALPCLTVETNAEYTFYLWLKTERGNFLNEMWIFLLIEYYFQELLKLHITYFWFKYKENCERLKNSNLTGKSFFLRNESFLNI